MKDYHLTKKEIQKFITKDLLDQFIDMWDKYIDAIEFFLEAEDDIEATNRIKEYAKLVPNFCQIVTESIFCYPLRDAMIKKGFSEDFLREENRVCESCPARNECYPGRPEAFQYHLHKLEIAMANPDKISEKLDKIRKLASEVLKRKKQWLDLKDRLLKGEW